MGSISSKKMIAGKRPKEKEGFSIAQGENRWRRNSWRELHRGNGESALNAAMISPISGQDWSGRSNYSPVTDSRQKSTLREGAGAAKAALHI
jgi:hypothetical protein